MSKSLPFWFSPAFGFLGLLFGLLNGSTAQATLLDLDLILKNDEAYIEKIRPLFLAIREVQIGGSNTYGNKTIIKDKTSKTKQKKEDERLDPSIMIINPDPKAHADREDVLGIQASAFSFETLTQLYKVTQLFQHHFKRIYINNLGYILPIPDHVVGFFEDATGEHIETQVSERQQKTFEEIEGCSVGDYRLEQSFFQYLQIRRQYPNHFVLYPFFRELLEKDGEFLFKSFSVTDQALPGAQCLFLKSFTFQLASLNLKAFQDKVLSFAKKEDALLYRQIAKKLTKVGDIFMFQRTDFEPNGIPDMQDSRATIRAQAFLLESSGFGQVEVGLGRFYDWRNNGINGDAYSIIIRAKKN